jgi:hypothetical protein
MHAYEWRGAIGGFDLQTWVTFLRIPARTEHLRRGDAPNRPASTGLTVPARKEMAEPRRDIPGLPWGVLKAAVYPRRAITTRPAKNSAAPKMIMPRPM